MHNLNKLAGEYHANSRRWFPDLHIDGMESHATAMHFALGLVGEVGEALEARLMIDPRTETPELIAGLAEELADVMIYALDLAAELEVDIPEAVMLGAPFADMDWAGMVIAAGLVCNVVKKMNRGDTVPPFKVSATIGRLFAEVLDVAAGYGIDLFAAMTAKVAVCEQRWGGGPRG